jgi:MFS family permease
MRGSAPLPLRAHKKAGVAPEMDALSSQAGLPVSGKAEGQAKAARRRAPFAFNIVNFFLADVAGGLGPFLPAWLASVLHWAPERIGIVMTVGSIAGLVFNTPAGAMVDRFGRPKLMIALGSAFILAGTLLLVADGSLALVILGLIVTALGAAVIAPAIAAASLRYVGQRDFPLQQGRNSAWSNGGNVSAALLILLGASWLGVNAPLLILGVMAAATMFALLWLRPPETRTAAASPDSDGAQGSIWQALRSPAVLLCGLALLFFHLGNAAMLPLLGLRLARHGQGHATEWVSACVIVAQFAMIGVALAAGRLTERYGKLPLFVLACVVLIVRGTLAAFANGPLWLIPIQLLDALGAGTLGVIVPPLAADLAQGTGRTQTVLGALLTLQGVGAALSSAFGGWLIAGIGWQWAFLCLGLPPVVSLLCLLGLRRGAAAQSAGQLRSVTNL